MSASEAAGSRRITRCVGKLTFVQKVTEYNMVETTVGVEQLTRDEALDVAGVTRCRDCKHYSDHEWVLVTDVSDVCHFFGDGVRVEPDGFCKWGELREVD